MISDSTLPPVRAARQRCRHGGPDGLPGACRGDEKVAALVQHPARFALVEASDAKCAGSWGQEICGVAGTVSCWQSMCMQLHRGPGSGCRREAGICEVAGIVSYQLRTGAGGYTVAG